MELHNEPFVPPTCPTEQHGTPAKLSPEQFHFYTFEEEGSDASSNTMTEIFGDFTELGSPTDENPFGNAVETDSAEVPIDSELSHRARSIEGTKEATRRLGAVLCERVRNCRGVIDGECWALGARAVMKAIREVGDA